MYNDQLVYIKANLEEFNRFLRDKKPAEIIKFLLSTASRPILTSNFGPNSASLIHAVSIQKPGIPLIWCDTGYNTDATLNFKDKLVADLPFKLKEYRSSSYGSYREVPAQDSDAFKVFAKAIKLDPFKKAINEHNPDVWFTNIRKGQTAFRDTLDILSISKEGILKVSPFYYWNDAGIYKYLKENNLPNEFNYFDPTKPKSNLECGIHIN